jgi:hypothetical protein
VCGFARAATLSLILTMQLVQLLLYHIAAAATVRIDSITLLLLQLLLLPLLLLLV